MQWRNPVTLFNPLFLLLYKRPAEIVDEEEDGEKTNKDVKQKEDFSAMNGNAEDGEVSEADAPKREEEIPDHGEEKASSSRVNGVTDEENGEELDQVTEELQPAVDEEGKTEGDNSGQDEVLVLFWLACA